MTMKKTLLLFLFTILSTSDFAVGQFGVGQKGAEATIDANGNTYTENEDTPTYIDLANTLRSHLPIDMQDAVDIAVLLETAASDPETRAMITRMKIEESEHLAKLMEDATQAEVVAGLQQALDEMKALEELESLPKDKVRDKLVEDGIIDKSQAEYYKANPEKLVEDLRQSLYFAFVTTALAGGFVG